MARYGGDDFWGRSGQNRGRPERRYDLGYGYAAEYQRRVPSRGQEYSGVRHPGGRGGWGVGYDRGFEPYRTIHGYETRRGYEDGVWFGGYGGQGMEAPYLRRYLARGGRRYDRGYRRGYDRG